MKRFLSHVMSSFVFVLAIFVCAYALADDSVIAPQDFFTQVMNAIQGFGGLSTMAKISAVVLLIVSSMKVSFMNSLIWSKLGAAKAWVAPLLGLIAGILGLGAGDQAITLPLVMAYVVAGGGAVIMHELLDSLKAIPGIGGVYLSIISIISSVLGGGTKPK